MDSRHGSERGSRELLLRYWRRTRADATRSPSCARGRAPADASHPPCYAGRDHRHRNARDFDRLRNLRSPSRANAAAGPTTCAALAVRLHTAGFDLLRTEGGLIVEIASFASPELLPAFGLPPTLSADEFPGASSL